MELKESENKKPADSDFQQQRLRAWQPLLTPNWVIGTFFLIGLIFIPIGVIILVYSNQVVEISSRYDNVLYNASGAVYPPNCPVMNGTNPTDLGVGYCNLLPTVGNGGTTRCLPAIDNQQAGHNHDACQQTLYMPITQTMTGPNFFYYKLVNYYQNHRRYVKSRSDTQLRGDDMSTSPCDPIQTNSTGANIYPCGLIAGSLFSDTFSASYCPAGSSNLQSDGVSYNCTVPWTSLGVWNDSNLANPTWQKQGIAWSSDVSDKFKDQPSTVDLTQTYRKSLLGYTFPDVTDEDFIVWMRTAGLPTFKKLYRKVSQTFNPNDVVKISYVNSYPVTDFSGEKWVVLSTTTWLGGKNSFLGWAYVIVGIICIVLALIFLVKHCTNPRPLGDMKYFQWPGQKTSRANL